MIVEHLIRIKPMTLASELVCKMMDQLEQLLNDKSLKDSGINRSQYFFKNTFASKYTPMDLFFNKNMIFLSKYTRILFLVEYYT